MPFMLTPASVRSSCCGFGETNPVMVSTPWSNNTGLSGTDGPTSTVWALRDSSIRRGAVLLTNAEPEMNA